ncbi:DUF418 domain-containing protein [Segetibacter sp. 3557_3]|uniref:DUF418 domain-containing protein n=1 Tax=Segetibacter sp. 3557_3 TaxID=2547429 RepID=UPI001058C2F2|nr:DUF418 domain-containing protein [Segetibacter sp. 3557_3]TDH20679.1 DUF418 domain-containing protein [Segetibacter sp. 3557_3]
MSSFTPDLPGYTPVQTGFEAPADGSPLHRVFGLDVLRGIAVTGALFISIWIFGGLTENRQNGITVQSGGMDYWLLNTMSVILEGKMLTLIALVFGASMLLYLFADNKFQRLRNADFFMRRQLWLIAIGLINALVFLWSNDIVFHLGLMGVLLFPFVRLTGRGLLVAALLAALIFSGKNYWRYADDQEVYTKYLAVTQVEKKFKKDSAANARAIAGKALKDTSAKQVKDTLTKKQKNEKEAWLGLVKNTKYDPKKDEEKHKAMRGGSYAKLWNHQLQGTQGREAQWTYQFGIWVLGAAILLGMALLKFNFFDPGFPARNYLLIASAGLVIGLSCCWFRLHYTRLALLDYQKYITRPLPYNLLFGFEMLALALAYASMMLLLVKVQVLKPVWRVFALAGQMSLSNYLLQSIICLLFFTGLGLGYFGRLQQWQLYVVAAEVVLVNLVFSFFWLSHFSYGPAEWLLRCLVYKRWITNRRNKVFESTIALS